MAAYFTGIPHPILLVQGEQGTAKSNLIRTLLALVDPQPAADRTPPADQREWAIFARASWAFSFDNITDIPPWLSNALCKGVTGDAVLQRVLHSDEDIGVYSFQRVIALTTIAIRHDVAGDLADRILLVEPEVIDKRRTEADVQRRPGRRAARRARRRPGPGRRRARASCPAPTVDNAPRMADFAKVLAALDTRDRLGHPGQLPGQGRQPGAVADRGQHLRLRHLPARHLPQPRRPRPGPVGRHRRRAARHPAADLRRRPAWPPATCPRTSARSAARSARSPRPCAKPASTSGPAATGNGAPLRIQQNQRPRPGPPHPFFLQKKKRHVTNVTRPHHRRSGRREG